MSTLARQNWLIHAPASPGYDTKYPKYSDYDSDGPLNPTLRDFHIRIEYLTIEDRVTIQDG